ncbi:class I SAM-dependent methyltransferase [Aeromicrobium sp. REDSEA-S38_B2]|uniref:class I SAM-dependent methyltransferase n=1 Tax=Aeromicrobium sp. REDSEA-S38_B2 TaxID=1811528 RepID=UPI000AB79213|nr:class I SAM-dependent methyltransferase [Aeromicrobium sp. REDSEA-S38_B2]
MSDGRRDSSGTWQRDHPWAAVYDRISGDPHLGALLWRVGMGSSVEELHRRARRELAAVPAGGTVLDLPCGGGVVLRDLPVDHALHYVAADISPAMLERTRGEAERLGVAADVETRVADVEQLADADETYDLVLTFTSLHCFPDPEAAVHELARVLRSGGRLVGSAFCVDAGLLYLPGHRIGRALGVLGPPVRSTEMRSWLVAAGLVDVRLDRAGALTYFEGTRA